MASVPSNAADVQSVVEERLQALTSSLEARQTATIEWRGRQTYVQVIDMPIDLLTYNPDTHRIRAQKSLDPLREHELASHPYGDPAQGYLHSLLRGAPEDPSREDPTFTALKMSLAEHDQEEPGIITRSGVLVNGNTRCAALRELSRDHMRVGVLPQDAGDNDIRSIELALQLRKEHKRDYSFVNFLLTLDERVAAGRPAAEILRDFRIRQATLDRSLWILEFIREAIERSRQETDGNVTQLRLVDFETHQGKLEELYRAYTTLKPRDPDGAEALREQRMLALALDKSKTDLRLIDQAFAPTYLAAEIPESAPAPPTRIIPGTSILTKQPSQNIQQLKALTNQVLRAKAVIASSGTDAPNEAVAEASRHVEDMKKAIDGALDKAGKNVRIQRRQVAPGERITDAVEDLDLAVRAIAEARAGARFEADNVEDALVSLRGSIERLAQQVSLSRGDDEPGDGTTWLLAAADAIRSE
jgi:hypothetical protein